MAYDDVRVIVENCFFKGNHIYGGWRITAVGSTFAFVLHRLLLRWRGFCAKRSRLAHPHPQDGIHVAPSTANDDDADEESWTPRFTIKRGGCVTFSATENGGHRWADKLIPKRRACGGRRRRPEGLRTFGDEPEPRVVPLYDVPAR